jgi:hypothetical protein
MSWQLATIIVMMCLAASGDFNSSVTPSLSIDASKDTWMNRSIDDSTNRSISGLPPDWLVISPNALEMLGLLGQDVSQNSICESLKHLDAALWDSGELILIAGQHFWKVNFDLNSLDGPFEVRSFWPEVMGRVCAACTLNKWQLMFTSTHYYVYLKNTQELVSMFPLSSLPDFVKLLRPGRDPLDGHFGCAVCESISRLLGVVHLISQHHLLTVSYQVMFNASGQMNIANHSVSDREFIIEQVKVGRCSVGEFLSDKRLLWAGSGKVSISSRNWPAPMYLTDYFNCGQPHMQVISVISFYSLCVCTLATILFLVYNIVWHPLARQAGRKSHKSS